MTRPSLAALAAFVGVARHGSFRRAAVERDISPSALSHVIRSLEEALDVRLFNRTSRSTSLTGAGRYLLDRIGPALGDVTEALDGVARFRGRPSGLLRVNLPRVANQMVVAPMVGRFLATYPEVRLEVASFDGLADIVAEGFDVGIRRDRRLSPGMIAVPAGPPRRFAVVGAPSYLAASGRPQVPPDLHAHRCIERRYPDGSRYAWEFARGEEAVELEVSGPLVADDTALMLQAALDGVGLAFVFEELASDHLASGRLVRVLEDWCPMRPRFFLYYPGRRHVSPALRAFIDMVREMAG